MSIQKEELIVHDISAETRPSVAFTVTSSQENRRRFSKEHADVDIELDLAGVDDPEQVSAARVADWIDLGKKILDTILDGGDGGGGNGGTVTVHCENCTVIINK